MSQNIRSKIYFFARARARGVLTEETRLTLRLLKQSPLSMFGIGIIIFLFIVMIFAPWIAPYDPYKINIEHAFEAPSLIHLMGTDEVGRDVFSRIIHGSRFSLRAGVIIVAWGLIIGTILGAVSGFLGGIVDDIIMRVTDMFLGFPAIVLAMAITAGLGPSLENQMIAMGVVWWPRYARLVRGSVLSIREKEYVEAAKAIGESNFSLILRYILPNSIAPVIVMTTLDIGVAILYAAYLSFIGLGVQAPIPEWGAMSSSGRNYLLEAWWISTFPGLAILVACMGFNFFGDGLRDAFDPRLRRR